MPVSTEPQKLRDPADHPDAELIVYDGHCRFCTQQVRRLDRLDRRGRLAFISLHDPRVAELLPDVTHEQLMEHLYLVDRQGRRYVGAEAFRYLSTRLWPLWPLAPLLWIPGSLPLWQACYRWVARQRYRWGRVDSCDDDACEIHFR